MSSATTSPVAGFTKNPPPWLLPAAVGVAIWWLDPLPLLGFVGISALMLGITGAGATYLLRRNKTRRPQP